MKFRTFLFALLIPWACFAEEPSTATQLPKWAEFVPQWQARTHVYDYINCDHGPALQETKAVPVPFSRVFCLASGQRGTTRMDAFNTLHATAQYQTDMPVVAHYVFNDDDNSNSAINRFGPSTIMTHATPEIYGCHYLTGDGTTINDTVTASTGDTVITVTAGGQIPTGGWALLIEDDGDATLDNDDCNLNVERVYVSSKASNDLTVVRGSGTGGDTRTAFSNDSGGANAPLAFSTGDWIKPISTLYSGGAPPAWMACPGEQADTTNNTWCFKDASGRTMGEAYANYINTKYNEGAGNGTTYSNIRFVGTEGDVDYPHNNGPIDVTNDGADDEGYAQTGDIPSGYANGDPLYLHGLHQDFYAQINRTTLPLVILGAFESRAFGYGTAGWHFKEYAGIQIEGGPQCPNGNGCGGQLTALPDFVLNQWGSMQMVAEMVWNRGVDTNACAGLMKRPTCTFEDVGKTPADDNPACVIRVAKDTNTGTGTSLVSSVNLTTAGVVAGDQVYNHTTGDYSMINSKDSDTTATLAAAIMNNGDEFSIDSTPFGTSAVGFRNKTARFERAHTIMADCPLWSNMNTAESGSGFTDLRNQGKVYDFSLVNAGQSGFNGSYAFGKAVAWEVDDSPTTANLDDMVKARSWMGKFISTRDISVLRGGANQAVLTTTPQQTWDFEADANGWTALGTGSPSLVHSGGKIQLQRGNWQSNRQQERLQTSVDISFTSGNSYLFVYNAATTDGSFREFHIVVDDGSQETFEGLPIGSQADWNHLYFQVNGTTTTGKLILRLGLEQLPVDFYEARLYALAEPMGLILHRRENGIWLVNMTGAKVQKTINLCSLLNGAPVQRLIRSDGSGTEGATIRDPDNLYRGGDPFCLFSDPINDQDAIPFVIPTDYQTTL